MGFPSNYTTITVSRETKQRLVQLKGEDTFDNVISNLLDLEERYNLPTEIIEYEYQIKEGSKLFRVTYSDKVKIEYCNRKELKWESDIKAWFTGARISDDELNSFIRFIIKDANLMLLYECDDELNWNDIYISKV